MANGVRTADVDETSVADSLIANRDGSTKRITVPSLGQQLLSDGPISDELEEVRKSSAVGGGLFFHDSLPELEAASGAQPGDTGYVLAGSQSGTYKRGDTSWSRTSDLPPGFAFQNIDDTADIDKPVSTAQQAEIVAQSVKSLAPIAPVTKALGSGDFTPHTDRSKASFFNESAGFADWAAAFDVGDDVVEGTIIDSIGLRTEIGGTVATLRLKVWSRDLADAGAGGKGPGEQPSDTLLREVDFAVSELGLDVGAIQDTWLQIAPVIAQSGLTYLVEVDARTALDERAPLGLGFGPMPGASQRQRGYYRNGTVATFWSNIGSNNALAFNLGQSVPIEVAEQKGRLDVLNAQVSNAFVPGFQSVASLLPDNQFTIAAGRYDWGIGIPAADHVGIAPVTGFRLGLVVATGTANVRFRLWSRPDDAAWINQGPGDASDELHARVVRSVADLGLTPGSEDYVSCAFEFDAVDLDPTRLYIAEIEALNASGERLLSGVQYVSQSGATELQYRKWWRSGAENAWSSGVTSTTFRLTYDLIVQTLSVPASSVQSNLSAVADRVVDASLAFGNGTAAIQVKAARYDQETTAAGSVVIADAASGDVIDEALTLNPRTGGAILWSYLEDRTVHANLRNVVVKDASTQTVLVKGTDYFLIEELGCFSLVGTTGTPRDVLVSYTWSDRRYDLISYEPATGAIAITQGQERKRDQSQFLPDTPIGHLPLFHVLVRYPEHDAVSVWDVANTVRRTSVGEFREDMLRNGGLLRPVLKKLRSGDPVTLLSYGDSNFAQMGGGYSLAAVRSAANTIYHDRSKGSGGLLQSPPLEADVIAAIPTYDTGDGQGSVHTRYGPVWELIRALQDSYASVITYQNRSIPGTNSTDSTYHGRDATRLTAAVDDAADLAFIGFGQNELGQSYTRDNVVAICEAFKAGGTMPIVVGCFRPNANDLHAQHTDDTWAFTQRALREAALFVGVPYLSTEFAYAQTELGALGLSRYDTCAGTLDVHPSPSEWTVFGKQFAQLLSIG